MSSAHRWIGGRSTLVDYARELSLGASQADDLTGYLHPAYARSLSEFGRPRHLPASGGWILEREIPGSDHCDAMGCYPLFVCKDWSRLCRDLEDARPGLVSLTFVTDPFAETNATQLGTCLDRVKGFKDHLVADLSRPAARRTSRRHREYARSALKHGISIERCDEPLEFLDDWTRLYDVLIEKHDLTGLQRFSRKAFQKQLSVPGVVMFRAVFGGATVAAHIWYLQGELAYSHLQATDRRGYEHRAAYALYSEGLDWLAGRCAYADIGAAAGAASKDANGLWHFKRGWARETRRTYLCMRVFDAPVYEQLARAAAPAGSQYLPAYRAGELV